jgi:anti-anti-sigma regulatory factor
MEITVDDDGVVSVVRIAGRPGPEDLRRCREQLLGTLGRARVIALDLGGLEGADLAFVQLLCAAHRTACARGCEMTLASDVPPALGALLERAGAERCAGGPPGCLMRLLIAACARAA